MQVTLKRSCNPVGSSEAFHQHVLPGIPQIPYINPTVYATNAAAIPTPTQDIIPETSVSLAPLPAEVVVGTVVNMVDAAVKLECVEVVDHVGLIVIVVKVVETLVECSLTLL